MTTLEEFRSTGEALEKTLLLRTAPLSVKLLENIMEMKFDFPRPPFYKDLYQMWDLDVEE